MSDRRIAASVALLSWLLLTVVTFLGSDKPPPVGFLILPALYLVAAWILNLRLTVYLRVDSAQRMRVFMLTLAGAALGGACVALLVAVVSSAVRGVAMIPMGGLVIWVAVVSFTSVAVALPAMALARLLQKVAGKGIPGS